MARFGAGWTLGAAGRAIWVERKVVGESLGSIRHVGGAHGLRADTLVEWANWVPLGV